MADRLTIYNSALRALGERSLSSLTEEREPRYELDAIYSPTVLYCLEDGAWDFAMRTAQVDASLSVTPEFGYQYAFQKPSDWVRTFQVSPSELLTPPLVASEFTDEAGYWYANVDPLFVKFVSRDVAYGLDLARWPESFAAYVSSRLAWEISARLTSSEDKRQRLEKEMVRLRSNALAKDAINSPVAFAPPGSWSRARTGFYGVNDYRRG